MILFELILSLILINCFCSFEINKFVTKPNLNYRDSIDIYVPIDILNYAEILANINSALDTRFDIKNFLKFDYEFDYVDNVKKLVYIKNKFKLPDLSDDYSYFAPIFEIKSELTFIIEEKLILNSPTLKLRSNFTLGYASIIFLESNSEKKVYILLEKDKQDKIYELKEDEIKNYLNKNSKLVISCISSLNSTRDDKILRIYKNHDTKKCQDFVTIKESNFFNEAFRNFRTFYHCSYSKLLEFLLKIDNIHIVLFYVVKILLFAIFVCLIIFRKKISKLFRDLLNKIKKNKNDTNVKTVCVSMNNLEVNQTVIN